MGAHVNETALGGEGMEGQDRFPHLGAMVTAKAS
jgi:hypothetical protein